MDAKEYEALVGRIERAEEENGRLRRRTRLAFVVLVAVVVWLGLGPQLSPPNSVGVSPARADVMRVGGKDVLITSSADGKTLYLWTLGFDVLDPAKRPRYKEKVEAQ